MVFLWKICRVLKCRMAYQLTNDESLCKTMIIEKTSLIFTVTNYFSSFLFVVLTNPSRATNWFISIKRWGVYFLVECIGERFTTFARKRSLLLFGYCMTIVVIPFKYFLSNVLVNICGYKYLIHVISKLFILTK